MGPVDFVVMFLLALCGVGLLLYLLWTIFFPLSLLFRGRPGSVRLARASRCVKSTDQLIEAKHFDLAIRELRRSLLVDVTGTEKLLRELKDHHQNILSRCIVIAEQLGGHLDTLPDVEKLLIERTQLLSLLESTHHAFHNVTEKRTRAGKALPAWSKEEYKNRAAQVKSELRRNLRELEAAYEKLFSSITTKEGTPIVYH